MKGNRLLLIVVLSLLILPKHEAEARYYDARVGRFLSVDRFTSKYPNYSPFNYAHGNPALLLDINGDSVDVASKDRSDYKKAKKYLSKSGPARQLFKNIENRKEHVKLTTNQKDDDSYENKEVKWDPRSGLDVSNRTGTQSPALGLLHEMAHAKDDLDGKLDRTPDSQYDNKAEKNVIEGIETTVAKDLGEPRRQDHRGDPVRTKSVSEHKLKSSNAGTAKKP